MWTAGAVWKRLEKSEEDEAEGRARGREAPAAPAGPAGRVGAGRAGPGGAAGRVPGAFPVWFPGWFPGLTQSRGRRSGGRDRSFNPFGTWDPQDVRDRNGRWARAHPKMQVPVPPSPSAPRPRGGDPASVPRECHQPCPHHVPTPGSPSLSPQLRVTRSCPPSLSPQPPTPVRVPSISVPDP